MTYAKRKTSSAAYTRKARDKRRDIGGKSSAPKRGLDFDKPDERDPIAWLLAYMPRAYPLPFGDVHRRIVDAFVYAIDHAGNVSVAAPRGSGKSTLVNGLLLWALMTKRSRFPAVILWGNEAKKRALNFWKGELCFNERLARDYPEICSPFAESRGVANRLAALTQGDETTGARLSITEGTIVLPGGLGAIGSSTINGNPRGLYYKAIDGSSVRPTLAVIDDPQDRETASSETLVRGMIERVDGDVAGMAGPDERMAMVMTCTVIKRGDVADYYLTHPDWQAIRVGQITAWPKDFTEKGSESRKLWDEWNDIRQDGEREKNEGKNALRFYVEHQAAMTEGMAVSWAERYDRKRGQPDALYAAMHDYYVMGEAAFAAERQNEPLKQGVTLYNLTPEIIQSRATDRAPGVVPYWATKIIASTDINHSYGLTWGIVAFEPTQRSAVVAYGMHKMHVAGTETKGVITAAIQEELIKLGKKFAALPFKPSMWVIDAGGMAKDAVLWFCRSVMIQCGLSATAVVGKGARMYRPWGKSMHGRPREECYEVVGQNRESWINWNSDYWREQAQKGWTGSIGTPGSCSLPSGHHREFAEQICREQLIDKHEAVGMMRWEWNTQPGAHDYGDVMAMAYMGAAWSGIGTSGQVDVTRKRPKANVFIRRPGR